MTGKRRIRLREQYEREEEIGGWGLEEWRGGWGLGEERGGWGLEEERRGRGTYNISQVSTQYL